MGFFGTTNLFEYAAENPVLNDDALGLWSANQTDATTALSAMWTQYQGMKKKNFKGADKYYHCMAHCQASWMSGTGLVMSLIVGYGREIIDFPKNIVKKNRFLSRICGLC